MGDVFLRHSVCV